MAEPVLRGWIAPHHPFALPTRACLFPVFVMLEPLVSQTLRQGLHTLYRLIRHYLQRRLHQAQLADKPAAVRAEHQVMTHQQTLAKGQLPIEIVTGTCHLFLTGQHSPVSSKCSTVAKTLSRARCNSTRTLESDSVRRLQISSNSSPWRSRNTSTLLCNSDKLSNVCSSHLRSSSSVSRASGVSWCQA